VALDRGSLRHPQWQEVAEVVSSRDSYSKAPKSDVQCKNRIDTLKKKYKVEKAKHDSDWRYFDRLDDLLAPVLLKPNSSSSSAAAAAAAAAAARSAGPMVPPRINFPQRTRTPLHSSAGAKWRMPSPLPQPSASSDSSDGFPPSAVANGKRQRVEEPAAAAADNGAESSVSRAQGLRELAQAIRRLGEVYERVESAKRDQELRMERERLDSARQLEEQRVQFSTSMPRSSRITRTAQAPPGAMTTAATRTRKLRRMRKTKRKRASDCSPLQQWNGNSTQKSGEREGKTRSKKAWRRETHPGKKRREGKTRKEIC
jgi:hypothetical protein